MWAYLREQKVEVNPLYCEGWKRVGCVGCPLAGKHVMPSSRDTQNFSRCT